MKSKSVRASLWTIAAFVTSQLLRLFSNLILTRLLLPEMFGLMAIVTVVRVGVYMCSEIGLKVNVIRHENGEDPVILNTAWTMQVIRGGLLWLLISLIAGFLWFFNGTSVLPAGSIYNDARLPGLLVITGVVAIITGFESTRVWLAQRNMMLGRLTFLDLITQFIGLIVMVWWAWAYKNVWALVVGSIVSASLRTVMSHYVLDGSNNFFCWNKKIVIEFLHFGKWLFLSAVITFFALNGDRVMLGGLITAEQLGFYAIAYFLATSLKDLVEKLTSNVWYPLLSQVHREEKEKIIAVYYSIRQKLDLMIYFSVGLLFVIAPVIIQILYDERYQESGWMLQVLAITLIGSSFRLGSTLLLAMGNPKIGTIAVAIRALALLIMIPWGFHNYGMHGAIWSIAINPLFEIPVILYFFSKYKIISWYKEVIFIPVIAVGYIAGDFFVKLLDFFTTSIGNYG
jgi:O-antigen/teichoic acid export membrane protein